MKLFHRRFLPHLVLLLAWSCTTHADSAAPTLIQSEAVAARISAFNRHDIESYLLAHKEDVDIYEFPEEPIGKGRAHLRRIFGPMLERKIGNIIVLHQTRVGNRVISEEQISYGPNQKETLVAIYTINQGLIESIHLIESEN